MSEKLEAAYEELREIIDGGSESFTHEDAVQYLKDILDQREKFEPVAWLCEPDENGLYGLPLSDGACKKCFPVYRSPSQRTWVGLTDDERLNIRSRVQEYTLLDSVKYGEAIQIATEQALMEKNG
jgi:hypothetical protein